MNQLIDTRPWPVPNRPWVMHQRWHDLLFAHWPVPIEQLRAVVPSSLPIDTFEGEAWVGVVPFGMSGVRPRGVPSIPYLSQFPEINLRTYVTVNGKPGVFFFSLDAHQRLAVEAARIGFHLSYFNADIHYSPLDDQSVTYHSIRKDKRADPAEFRAIYRPTSEVYRSVPGELDHWLTERYCLYSVDKKGRVYRGEIDHIQWALQHAEADIQVNTLPASMGIELPHMQPLLHYSKVIDVHIWLLERV